MAIMVMAHMQRAGHTPIALMGGGTAMVGDPSGKTDMRKMLTAEEIADNVEKIKDQFFTLYRFFRRQSAHGKQCRLANEPKLCRAFA